MVQGQHQICEPRSESGNFLLAQITSQRVQFLLFYCSIAVSANNLGINLSDQLSIAIYRKLHNFPEIGTTFVGQ
jgi:hypothetical protein